MHTQGGREEGRKRGREAERNQSPNILHCNRMVTWLLFPNGEFSGCWHPMLYVCGRACVPVKMWRGGLGHPEVHITITAQPSAKRLQGDTLSAPPRMSPSFLRPVWEVRGHAASVLGKPSLVLLSCGKGQGSVGWTDTWREDFVLRSQGA